MQASCLSNPVLSAVAAPCPRFYYHMKLEVLVLDCEKLKAGAIFSFFWCFYLGPWSFYRREPWVGEVKQSSLGHIFSAGATLQASRLTAEPAALLTGVSSQSSRELGTGGLGDWGRGRWLNSRGDLRSLELLSWELQASRSFS